MSDVFTADWLALREPFDAVARSRELGEALSTALPKRPRLLDLGAGTGSLFRWLAPIVARPQVWTWVDANRALLDEGLASTQFWARGRGFTVTYPARAMIVHTPTGAWRIETVRRDIATAPQALITRDVDAVVCSALLDLVSVAWIRHVVQETRVPFLASLTVDGRDAWMPPHRLDGLVRRLFRRDQERDKGFGPALGARAVTVAETAFARAGFTVCKANSDWRLERDDQEMVRQIVLTMTEALLRRRGPWVHRILAWDRKRLEQSRRGRLAIRIGHRDILALPRGG
jgi:hypothetical protein